MRMILLNKWVRADASTALIGIPASYISHIEQADQFALTDSQREVCRSVLQVKGSGLLYVRETVEQVADALNGNGK